MYAQGPKKKQKDVEKLQYESTSSIHTPWILENLIIVTDSIGVHGKDVTQSQVAIDFQQITFHEKLGVSEHSLQVGSESCNNTFSI